MLYGAETWTLRRNEKKQLEVFEIWLWRRMERVKWRQNQIWSCARKSGRRKNNAGTDKEEENNWLGHRLRRNYLLKDRRYGKWEGSSRQKKISDDRQHYDKWTL